MKRGLAWTLAAIMGAMVVGQAVKLQRLQPQPVTEIRLHESRLLAFLQEIRADDPDTYDSILLNLQRLKDGPAQGQNLQLEEVVVAEELLARLTSQLVAPKPAASGAAAR